MANELVEKKTFLAEKKQERERLSQEDLDRLPSAKRSRFSSFTRAVGSVIAGGSKLIRPQTPRLEERLERRTQATVRSVRRGIKATKKLPKRFMDEVARPVADVVTERAMRSPPIYLGIGYSSEQARKVAAGLKREPRRQWEKRVTSLPDRIAKERRNIRLQRPITKRQAALRQFRRSSVGSVFPLPGGAGKESRTVQGRRGGGRGRPKGSFAAKYAPYGGVYGYRKFVRAQKALRRAQDAGVVSPQQARQVQQYSRAPQEFGRTSRSQPVDTRPLRSNAEYTEVVDMFSGKRKLKRKLPSERWIR